MKSLSVVLVLMVSANAFGFAVQDMQKPLEKIPGTKVARDFGPAVKLDLSYNHCVKKGDSAYSNTLFYEEFESMAECQKALDRG